MKVNLICPYGKLLALSVAIAVTMLVATPAIGNKGKGKPGGGNDGPTPAEENPAIAFVTDTNSRQDVVVAAADMNSEIVLTQGIQYREKGAWRYTFGSPTWSPDGTMVAFGALLWYGSYDDRTGEQLFVAKADGSQVMLVRDYRTRPTLHRLNHTGGLSWSPTGAEIVYEGYNAIVAIDAAGDINVLLDGFYTDDPVGQPVLSPDMDDAPGYQGMIAMVGLDGSVDAQGAAQADIFVAPIATDADGFLLPVDPGLIVNVTDAPGTNEFHPSWSPDGSAIACFHKDGADEWLAVIDLPSGLRLPIHPDYATQGNGQDRATWTSDGWGLVYRTEFSGIDRFDLTIISSDGQGGPTNFTNTDRRELAPAWNPQWDPFGPGAM